MLVASTCRGNLTGCVTCNQTFKIPTLFTFHSFCHFHFLLHIVLFLISCQGSLRRPGPSRQNRLAATFSAQTLPNSRPNKPTDIRTHFRTWEQSLAAKLLQNNPVAIFGCHRPTAVPSYAMQPSIQPSLFISVMTCFQFWFSLSARIWTPAALWHTPAG